MKQEKYGFIYIWYDMRNKMFYVGSHWGTKDDGYICSSIKMLRAYYKRKGDFKRRIIKYIYTNTKDLLKEEDRWLKMIDPSKTIKSNTSLRDREKNVRYYNINLKAWDVWHRVEEQRKTVGQKISASKKGKSTIPCSPEKAARISEAKKSKKLKFTDEHKQKLREAKLGTTHTEEWKMENSIRLKEQWKNGTRTSSGPLSEEHKGKISKSSKGRKLENSQIQQMKENIAKEYLITFLNGDEKIIKGLKQYGIDNNIPYVTLFKASQHKTKIHKYNIESIQVINK